MHVGGEMGGFRLGVGGLRGDCSPAFGAYAADVPSEIVTTLPTEVDAELLEELVVPDPHEPDTQAGILECPCCSTVYYQEHQEVDARGDEQQGTEDAPDDVHAQCRQEAKHTHQNADQERPVQERNHQLECRREAQRAGEERQLKRQ